MRDVDAAKWGDFFAQFGQFVFVGVNAGDVIEAARQADGPLLHPFAHKLPHRAKFVRGRPPRCQPHRFHPHVPVGNQRADVDGTLAVELREVLGDGVPMPVRRREVAVEPRGVAAHVFLRGGRTRREGDAVLPEHVRSHALPYRRFVIGIDEQGEIAMDMGIDEAGANDFPHGIEDGPRLGIAQRSDGGNRPAANRHVGGVPRQAAAIHHAAAANDAIVHG